MTFRPVILIITILVAGSIIIFFPMISRELDQRRIRENQRVVYEALSTIKNSRMDESRSGTGVFWTSDVAGLWHQGRRISRELAEADAAPLKPLVQNPRSYHGYFFVAMRPEDTDEGYRIYAYPEEYGVSGRMTYLVTYLGIFRADLGGNPVPRFLSWEDLRRDWWIID